MDLSKPAADPFLDAESAAKTALLLNEGTLDGAHLHVTSESLSSTSSVSGEEGISQEDKPKVRTDRSTDECSYCGG